FKKNKKQKIIFNFNIKYKKKNTHTTSRGGGGARRLDGKNSSFLDLKQKIDYNKNYKLKEIDKDEIKDSYQIKWVGKNYAKLQENLKPQTVIVSDTSLNESPQNQNSKNLFLTGDNLEVLKHLVCAYENKVDMIYIDPPYNTGSDDFVYKDKFEFTAEQLENTLELSPDEARKIKNLYGKSSHSAWLTFMYPRLKIAMQLLKDSGVIFMSIDDNECANLKLICDEIFGDGNFVGDLIWLKGNAQNDAHDMQKNYDHTLVYRKRINENSVLFDHIIQEKEVFEENGKYWYVGAGMVMGGGEGGTLSGRPNLGYSVYYNPKTKDFKAIEDQNKELAKTSTDIAKIYTDNKELLDTGYAIIRPPQNGSQLGCWKWGIKRFNSEKNRILIKKSNNGYSIYRKEFIEETIAVYKKDNKNFAKLNKKFPLKSFFGVSSAEGTNDLSELFEGKKVFTNPKPLNLISHFIKSATKSNDIILDFFAGSGTTAQAVMQLNADDGGNRKFILCTLDEPVKKDSPAQKAGFKTIDEIARERIIRASKKIQEKIMPQNLNNFDAGFKHYFFKEANIETLDKIENFDLNQTKLLADDMISPFSQFSLSKRGDKNNGAETILNTWFIDDGYTFEDRAKIEILNLQNYKAYYAPEFSRLYLIYPDTENWTSESLKTLLNKMGKNEISVTNIIIYAYSFNFKNLTELKNNLNANIKNADIIKNLKVLERY
ncbi:MAG: site-specific DNA-methyltransferase, partial [Elusimicrobiota bacterium]|nr:site-specific DNA-methyltransferase [Elusimicrobiota bacterium]